MRSRSDGNLPFAINRKSVSADDLEVEDNDPPNDRHNDNDCESVSTSSTMTSSSTNPLLGLNRKIQNLSTKMPTNLTPPAHRSKSNLSKIQTNVHPFAASPSSPAPFSSQTPPGIGKDRHMPALNLSQRKHYSEPMGGVHGHRSRGSGPTLGQRTGSISITRSKPLSIHKTKQKSKFDVDFHLASSFQVMCQCASVGSVGCDHSVHCNEIQPLSLWPQCKDSYILMVTVTARLHVDSA